MEHGTNRRDFMKLSAVGASLAVAGSAAMGGCEGGKLETIKAQATKNPGKQAQNMCGYAAPKIEKVRVGFIGLGMRGPGAVNRISKIKEGVEIVALCDLRPQRVANAQKILKKNNLPAAKEFTGEDGWKKLCELKDLDLVYIASPWRLHTPMAVHAMECGKHAACEVPIAMSVEECWQLVNTSERTKKHCMQLENCCYDFFEMMTLNMCRKGALGELIHGEAAYIHDLRGLNFNKNGYQGMWRLIQNMKRDGNLYPTHGLGPISQCMNINRGDKYEYLTSMSSNDFNMKEFAIKRFGKDSEYGKFDDYRGNMNTTLIRTNQGRTIMVQHDVSSPRPYSRIHLISGSKGIARKWPGPAKVAFGHRWADSKKMAEIKKQFEHPLCKKIGAMARKVGGHGGMDFMMDWRLIQCLRNGEALDQDVYDAAAWSVVGPLSEWSVANQSNSIVVPDFTRGAWKNNKPLGIIS